MNTLSSKLITSFLEWLEEERKCSISTRSFDHRWKWLACARGPGPAVNGAAAPVHALCGFDGDGRVAARVLLVQGGDAGVSGRGCSRGACIPDRRCRR